MGAVANVGAVIASTARAVTISIVALLCVLRYSLGSLRRLAMRDRGARERHRARQRGHLWRWSFELLGASFIKVGQVMSSRPDVFCPAIIDELRGLQDHVRPFSYRRMQRVVERELRAPLQAIFSELDREPIAAGSMAQVHRAVLRDGREVAVKVLRPGVRAAVHRDARILLLLARMAEMVSARARAADVRGHARGLAAGLLAQADLRLEANNYDRFREDFAGNTDLAFPLVYHEYSTREVLTMELVHGETLDRAAPEHLPQVTRVMRASFFEMCFEHGLVHADLHPGNILVRPDGVLVMLDVGLVKHLTPGTVDTIVDFARCLVIGTARELVHHLQSRHEHAPTTDWREVEIDVTFFIASIRNRSMAELETATVVSRLFALARKHQIRPMAELSLVLLGMVTIEGVAKRLDPSANTLHEIAAFLGPRLARRRLARGSREWLPPVHPAMIAPKPEPTADPPAPVEDQPQKRSRPV